MKVLKIVAASAAGLLVANTAANLTINKVRNSAGARGVLRDAARVVATPAVVTYRRSATNVA
jgi:hypothetical protein